MKNIVLVHGGFVDGAGWEGVYRILKQDGYDVSIVQNPTISLAHDVAATKRILVVQDGPAILVGHSYGGAVITDAGNDPKVAALVYIAAFAPDKGESVATLIKDPPPGAPVPPILPPQDGYLLLDKGISAQGCRRSDRTSRRESKGSRRLDQAISLTTGSAGLRFRTHFRQKSGYYANNLEREGRLNDISSAILH